jgi:sec-independent protein translocase protein TatA
MPNIGPLEIVVVLIIVLVIFGPKRLPDLGRSLGRGMREFKESVTGKDNDELPAGESTAKPEPARAEAADPPEPAATGGAAREKQP